MRVNRESTLDLNTVRLIVTDLDGIWTDGGIFIDDNGRELVRFSVYDGMGVALARKAGLRLAVISARHRPAVQHRCRDLGVDELRQASADKKVDFLEVCRKLDVTPAETLYLGDDLNDLRPMALTGGAITVPNAAPEVLAAAHWVTGRRGGEGALRETIEWLLRATNRWEATIAAFQPETVR